MPVQIRGRKKGSTSAAATGMLCAAMALLVVIGARAQDPTPIFPIPHVPVTLDGTYVGPGRGLTKNFEIQFMESTIDHHFSALRMTELAAGTAQQRISAISPDDGVAPTPGYSATPAKSNLDDLRSLARRENRTQREEILTMQSFLKDWYGISYRPKVTPENAAQIEILENASSGSQFDKLFFEILSRHHFTLLGPLNECITGSELLHPDLISSCNEMWHSQISDITTMRRELARHYAIVDYQPFQDPKGQHSAPEK